MVSDKSDNKDKSEKLRSDLKQKEASERQAKTQTLREGLDTKTSDYSPDMLHHKAVEKLATFFTDALYDIDPEENAYFSYIRAIDAEIVSLPGTMAFINSKLNLSISHDRKGRREYTETLTQRQVLYPQTPAAIINAGMQQEQKRRSIFPLFKRKQNEEPKR